MKKIIYILIALAIIILAVRFFIGGDEDTWICERGEWVKHGAPGAPIPDKPCEEKNSGMFNALEKAEKRKF